MVSDVRCKFSILDVTHQHSPWWWIEHKCSAEQHLIHYLRKHNQQVSPHVADVVLVNTRFSMWCHLNNPIISRRKTLRYMHRHNFPNKTLVYVIPCSAYCGHPYHIRPAKSIVMRTYTAKEDQNALSTVSPLMKNDVTKLNDMFCITYLPGNVLGAFLTNESCIPVFVLPSENAEINKYIPLTRYIPYCKISFIVTRPRIAVLYSHAHVTRMYEDLKIFKQSLTRERISIWTLSHVCDLHNSFKHELQCCIGCDTL